MAKKKNNKKKNNNPPLSVIRPSDIDINSPGDGASPSAIPVQDVEASVVVCKAPSI